MKLPASLLALALAATSTQAELVEETVSYDHDGTTLEGFHVYDDATEGKRPGGLVIHQGTGLGEYETQRYGLAVEVVDEGRVSLPLYDLIQAKLRARAGARATIGRP